MKLLYSLLFLFISTVCLAQRQDNASTQPDPSEIDHISIEEPKITDKHVQNNEIFPSFPGGPDAFMNYITKSIIYPEAAKVKNKQGTVKVQFIIEKDGSLSTFKVVQSVNSDLDKEAIRVIKNSPKWNPGMQNGLPVRVLYTVPVNFNIN
jgi:protein TonB